MNTFQPLFMVEFLETHAIYPLMWYACLRSGRYFIIFSSSYESNFI